MSSHGYSRRLRVKGIAATHPQAIRVCKWREPTIIDLWHPGSGRFARIGWGSVDSPSMRRRVRRGGAADRLARRPDGPREGGTECAPPTGSAVASRSSPSPCAGRPVEDKASAS